MLSESEIIYLKKLLKLKHIDTWKKSTIMQDLHKITRYTIRKLTYQMANIDNYIIFKRLKEPTYENNLMLVYRAEQLY
jgi:hypothetical protein